MRVLRVILSSELPEHIKFYGIIDRDDMVVSISREQVKKARDKVNSAIVFYPDNQYTKDDFKNLTELWRIMNESGADMIFLDDRSIDPDADETRSFYYRCN